MNQKPRIAIVGGAGLSLMAVAALSASADVLLLDRDDRRFMVPDFELFPAPEPPRYVHREPEPRQPIILGGGVKYPKWPTDPVKAAARKRQRAARRKSR